MNVHMHGYYISLFSRPQGDSWDMRPGIRKPRYRTPHVLALTHATPGARTHDTPGPKNHHPIPYPVPGASTGVKVSLNPAGQGSVEQTAQINTCGHNFQLTFGTTMPAFHSQAVPIPGVDPHVEVETHF